MKKLVHCVSFCLLLSLTACGEGWEKQLTNTAFPYGNARTAGSGIAYVRAKMLPEKDVKLFPVSEKVKETVTVVEKVEAKEPMSKPEPPPEPKAEPEKTIETMEPVFKEKQEK